MKPIRILLVDDHTLVRSGIRSLLQGFSGIEVVGEAGNGRDALALVKTLLPDIVLMDIAMTGLNGIDAVRRIRQSAPTVRVLMLSMHTNEEYVWQALRSGARGYLLKDAAPSELEVAVHAVARGERYLSPALSKYSNDGDIERRGPELAAFADLTSRQREVLQWIAAGRTNKEIAVVLGLSVKTIDTHRTELMRRLDIHDVAGLVRYAIRTGLASSES